jgi:hypothetical protein
MSLEPERTWPRVPRPSSHPSSIWKPSVVPIRRANTSPARCWRWRVRVNGTTDRVLSDSTERYDRSRKAEHYRRIPSLEEYLITELTCRCTRTRTFTLT